ncbi:hypothetical protein [Kiloniella sp.]|uniref:hypothetical protein n=1 Tax=Kiloniella sp. TaxID=1938587 RepID=UPI003B01720C
MELAAINTVKILIDDEDEDKLSGWQLVRTVDNTIECHNSSGVKSLSEVLSIGNLRARKTTWWDWRRGSTVPPMGRPTGNGHKPASRYKGISRHRDKWRVAFKGQSYYGFESEDQAYQKLKELKAEI